MPYLIKFILVVFVQMRVNHVGDNIGDRLATDGQLV